MLSLSLMVFTVLFYLSHAHGHSKRCITETPAPEKAAKINSEIRSFASSRFSYGGMPDLGSIVVPTYFVIFQPNNGQPSEMTNAVVTAQFQILNDNFAATPFIFFLMNVTYVVNDVYYINMTGADYTIGSLYKKGGPETLMVYFGGKLWGGSWSRFPALFNTGVDLSRFNIIDGTFMDINTVPGGRASCCNLGKTLTHEVGHWLGLYHTFEGNSCNANNTGDFVSDTPQQASYSAKCPIGRDSCPGQPGIDPINNYMDYTDDPCLEEFTAGQIQRMFIVWSLYRKMNERCASDSMLLKIELNLDRYAGEVSWELKGPNLYINPVRNGYLNSIDGSFSGKTIVHDICLPINQQFTFTIFDSQGDGLQPPGSYKLYLNNVVVKTGQSYGFFESTNISTTVAPSSIVTPAPTPAPGSPSTPTFPFQLCFSGETTVVVKDKGTVFMKDLQLGDEVLGAAGEFETVYSFGHRHETVEAVFLRFLPSGIEISFDHMLKVDGQFIPASDVTVGDNLQTFTGEHVAVEAIQTVGRNGVYAPFTASGTIIVSNIISSNYIAFQGSDHLVLGGWRTPFSYQWLAHASQAPHRVWFRIFGVSQETYAENGKSSWIDGPHHLGEWCLEQHAAVTTLLLLPVLLCLLIFSGIDIILSWVM